MIKAYIIVQSCTCRLNCTHSLQRELTPIEPQVFKSRVPNPVPGQRCKQVRGKKGENNARIGGMLHTEFLLKIFIYMLFCGYFKIIFITFTPDFTDKA